MKKKKIFGKKQVVMAGLVVALAGAVWLNMQYSSDAGGFVGNEPTSSIKNLGDTQYVMNETTEKSDTGEADYFTTAKSERESSRKEAVSLLKETVDNVKSSDEAKKQAEEKINEIALRIEKESSIETLIKSKGFEEAVVIISDESVTVIVKGEELLASQTLQIQDAVLSQTEISLEKIKIVAVK